MRWWQSWRNKKYMSDYWRGHQAMASILLRGPRQPMSQLNRLISDLRPFIATGFGCGRYEAAQQYRDLITCGEFVEGPEIYRVRRRQPVEEETNG